ncbi:hypothetical protein FXO38_02550 [Capsicum annuum]|nr:hypothetical protein FXO38_02550 [Capsicum annuum]
MRLFGKGGSDFGGGQNAGSEVLFRFPIVVFTRVFNVRISDDVTDDPEIYGLTTAKVNCAKCGMLLGCRLIAVPQHFVLFREGRFCLGLNTISSWNGAPLNLLDGVPLFNLDGEQGLDANDQNADQDGGANEQNADQDGGANEQNADQDGDANEQNYDQDGGINEQVPNEQDGGPNDHVGGINEQDGGPNDQVGGVNEQDPNEQDGGANEQNADQDGGANEQNADQDGDANEQNHDQDGSVPAK